MRPTGWGAASGGWYVQRLWGKKELVEVLRVPHGCGEVTESHKPQLERDAGPYIVRILHFSLSARGIH